jgi:hypothetical protein
MGADERAIMSAIIAGLSTLQRIALRRANGERFPGTPVPVEWRTGPATSTWRSLDRRKLVSWSSGDGWVITDKGRDIADRLAAEARAGYLFPGQREVRS